MRTENLQELVAAACDATGFPVVVVLKGDGYALHVGASITSYGTLPQVVHELSKLKRDGADRAKKSTCVVQKAAALLSEARAMGVKIRVEVEGREV